MRMLCIYLRTTGRTRILEHRRSFMLVGIEVARGGGTIGKTPLRTRIGIDVWNQLRRQARAKIVITDSEEGGPGPVLAFITNEQRYVSAVHRGFLGMERWFAIDERVPSYTSDRATLPLYRSQEERDEISAQLVSVMNELQL
ncbi:hypothetical protein PLICRDRAFT_52274 [Plicaturopsis crispa FD-325 SS-3]|nr:hypothetical protein PLICRDRAFT_52274 [Plicaturopsis crispa FD-325 SS-3]